MLLVHTLYDLEWLEVKCTILQGVVYIRCSEANDCNFISSDVNNLQRYYATNILFQLASFIWNFYELKEASSYILYIYLVSLNEFQTGIWKDRF